MSKTTALAWAKWRVGHPNWKPNPKLKRPRYKMSQHEILKKVELACQVPTDPKYMDALFTPEDLYPPTPEVALDDKPIETTDETVPDTIPPLLAEVPPISSTPFAPGNFVPPSFGPVYGGAVPPPVIPPGLHVSAPILPPAPPEIPVIAASPVPEPSSLVLLLLGMSSGGAVRVWRGRLSAAID